jgi:hypothetical protein
METVKTPPEQRTVLRNVSWETYERLLADHVDSSSPRFTYDRGVLEIMVVSERHERPNRLIAQLVEVLAEEMDLDLDNLGSATFKREDLQRGFEPDSCFYIQNEEQIRGKANLDLTSIHRRIWSSKSISLIPPFPGSRFTRVSASLRSGATMGRGPWSMVSGAPNMSNSRGASHFPS